jgi:hypothetical protein
MTSNLAPLDGLRSGWAGALAALPKAALPLIVAATVFSTCLLAGVPGVWLGGPAEGDAVMPVAVAAEAPEGAELAPLALTKDRRARSRCETCGVLLHVQKIEPLGGEPAAYEFTVRLRDGSLRTQRSASAGNWRSGDRIMLLGGSKAPGAIHN